MSAARTRLRVVIDGSNLATEGRVDPSLSQLDDAISAFEEENPRAEIVVVVDASFGHRVASVERGRFKDRELDGTIVTPPAGAIGRGDAFILKIADRINGVVLSNDSFQEFHAIYPWLFDEGRLIGGKPVPGVGWIFTPRLPVRGAKSSRAVKKLAVLMPEGVTPSIGTTITPAKPAVKAPAAKRTSKRSRENEREKEPVKPAEKPAEKPTEKQAEKPTEKQAEKPARTSKRTAKAVRGSVEPSPTRTAVANGATKAAKKVEAVKKAPAKKVAPAKAATKRVAKSAAPAKSQTPVPEPSTPPTTPVVALRRGRQPVNPEDVFARFRSAYKVGSRLEGEVTTFTSHGAVITVTFKGGQVECYAPTTLLGDPPPPRARDVLKRGDRRTFRLITVDPDRRIAELALA